MTVTAGEVVGEEERDSAGMPRPFYGALKDARTGRWFRGVGDDRADDLADVATMAPPLEDFEAFVAAGPYKAAFEELRSAPPPKRQAAGDQIHEAARKLSAALPSLDAAPARVAALGGPASFDELNRLCNTRPSFRAGKCCASGDCVRRLWYSCNEDAWGVYKVSRESLVKPSPQHDAPSSGVIKDGVKRGFGSTIGGYADTRLHQGDHTDTPKERRAAAKRQRLEAAEATKDAEHQRVVAKEERAVRLAMAKQPAGQATAAAARAPWLMCINAALFFVDEEPHWLYAKSPDTGRTRCARLGINRHCETGQRVGCRNATQLAQLRCCDAACCNLIEEEEHAMWIELWKDADSDRSRWSVLKRHTVHHPDMCMTGRTETFGCSKYLVNSAETADRWSTEQQTHGNTGRVPWNKCPELLTSMVKECLEIYTYTDPSSGVATADDLAKRRWSSTAVSCIRDLYDKFLELWGGSWREARARARHAKELQMDSGSAEDQADDRAAADRAAANGGAEEQQVDQAGEEDEDQQRGEHALASEEKDISYATFKRQIDGINEGDCCALCKASYDHNKCSECKEAELTIKEEGMQAKQAARRLALLPEGDAYAARRHELAAKIEKHQEAQRTTLHKYRRHNSFDYHQRFHFTHMRRVTKAVSELQDRLPDGELGRELSDDEFKRQLAESRESQRAPEMLEYYSHASNRSEPALVQTYTPDPVQYSDVTLHRPSVGRGKAKFVSLSRRKEAKDLALARGKTNGSMRIPTSQTQVLGHWASSKRARKHWRGDLTAEVRRRTFLDDVDEPEHRRKVRRLNYITRQHSGVAQWPTVAFRESLARGRGEAFDPADMEPQPDFVEPDGKAMSRTFHLPTTPNFYEPAVAALDQRFAAEDKECDMQHLVEEACALNGAPMTRASTTANLPCNRSREAEAQHRASLGQLNLRELQALCDLHGLSVTASMKKKQLVDSLFEKLQSRFEKARDVEERASCPLGSFAQVIQMFHVDDMSDQNIPSDPNDVPGLLEKIPIHVHGHYDMGTGRMYTTLMEPGAGSKDTDCVLDELLADLIATCGAERPAVIYITNDCGPLQLNQFQVQMAQFLVDRGFCKFCVLGYHQQLHGKYHCDYKFGNYTIAWTTKATFTIDDLARLVETLPKCNKNGTRVRPEDKDVCAIMRPNAGTVYRHHLGAMYMPVSALSQTKNNIHIVVVGHDLESLSNEAVTVRRTRNNGTSVEMETSLRLEMAILSAGKRGVARMWTYAPRRTATAISGAGQLQELYTMARRQTCDEADVCVDGHTQFEK